MLSVTCEQRALYSKLQMVARGVSGRSTQPIQNNIYLEAADGMLTLVATDLEFIGVKTFLPCEVLEEGAITVPARFVTDVAGRLPAGDVQIVAVETNSVQIRGGKSQFSIRALPPDDFEQLPPLDDPLTFSMTQASLLEMLDLTVFATSTDETRPILTGALMKLGEGKLDIVSTDTYRLALCSRGLGAPIDRDHEAIVSRRALIDLQRILDDETDEEVRISVSQNQIEFVIGDTTIGSRLIDGQFVNYPKVIPTGGDRLITVDVADLTAALERALIVARQDAYRVVLRASGETMTISARSQDVGEVEEAVAVRMQGEDAEVAFNADSILQMLHACESEDVVLELSGPLNSGLLKPVGDEGYLYVLMPMQIM